MTMIERTRKCSTETSEATDEITSHYIQSIEKFQFELLKIIYCQISINKINKLQYFVWKDVLIYSAAA